ncbi:hypothetical protein FJT64_007595 [Amphibalanus amphitrite]|uniref:Uncharacterized protein n=1 Tax=Amphibalanus amphitrite TaxID=1232801 RepID=A0A6A4VT73_AMPAM|nr:hypothetical protein FJT64_007595 [Amphibalanus amphitrite]
MKVDFLLALLVLTPPASSLGGKSEYQESDKSRANAASRSSSLLAAARRRRCLRIGRVASSGSALFGFMWPMLLGNSGGDSFLTGVPSKMEETGVLAESPEGSSTGSSREPSPNSSVRRQSTTEEILIAKGFRRQSTTEDIIRCRNFRRQSTLLDEAARCRGRRDSATQILDGTVATMTVESAGVVYDTSTQTDCPFHRTDR